jgi:hypothetical protein
MERSALQGELASLRDLLHHNNMKAMAQFEALRPVLARMAPESVLPLADAVLTLRFDAAGALVEQLIAALGKEDA